MEQQTPVTPTPASQWKTSSPVEGQDVVLPSGNVARCKRLSPQAFLTSGTLPDPLSAIVKKAIHTKQGLNPKDVEKISQDPEMLASALETFDRVLEFVMVEPRVSMPPACVVVIDGEECGLYANTEVHRDTFRSGRHAYQEGPRDPNILYADIVDMDDKMFLFQWALTGAEDLTSFRAELAAAVGSLPDGEDVPGEAQQPA